MLRLPKIRHAIVPLALSALCGGAALEQASAQSTDALGPIVLRLPASARAAALANSFPVGNDADAFLYNPARLPNASGSAASIGRYGANATTGALAMTNAAGSNTIGIGVQFLAWSAPARPYGAAVQPGASHLSDSGTVAASSTAITVGVARRFFGKRVGVNMKYVEDRLANAHDGTLAFDAGAVLWSVGPGAITVVAQNVGRGLRLGGVDGRLPTSIGIGFGGDLSEITESLDLGMQTQLTVERGGFVRPAGGAELGYVPIGGVSVIARAGLRLPREKDESLATGGLGVRVDRFSLDYAFEPFRGGRPATHRLGIVVK